MRDANRALAGVAALVEYTGVMVVATMRFILRASTRRHFPADPGACRCSAPATKSRERTASTLNTGCQCETIAAGALQNS